MHTEQNDDAQQDGHQGGGAEAGREQQSIHTAGAQVSRAVTATHTDGQCTGAALDRIITVGDHHGQVVRAHLLPVKATPSGQDPCSVIWNIKHRAINLQGSDPRTRNTRQKKTLRFVHTEQIRFTFVVKDGKVRIAGA